MPEKKTHRLLVLKILLGVVFMFGFSYMMVPLYTLVCQNLGINGRISNTASTMEGVHVDTSRVIHVTFTATIHGSLGFVFKPLVTHVDVHPGEKKLIYFYAENKTGHPITVQAIPSVTPDEFAKLFKKTECFCFTQQYFFKGEKADMPVYFYVDPAIVKDAQAITLSYTLFDVTDFIKKDEQYYRQGRVTLNDETDG